jgi:hypothetical protein
MKTYEYKLIELKKDHLFAKDKDAQTVLNDLGAQGWELVGMAPSRSLAYGGDKLGAWCFVLKRELQ